MAAQYYSTNGWNEIKCLHSQIVLFFGELVAYHTWEHERLDWKSRKNGLSSMHTILGDKVRFQHKCRLNKMLSLRFLQLKNNLEIRLWFSMILTLIENYRLIYYKKEFSKLWESTKKLNYFCDVNLFIVLYLIGCLQLSVHCFVQSCWEDVKSAALCLCLCVSVCVRTMCVWSCMVNKSEVVCGKREHFETLDAFMRMKWF